MFLCKGPETPLLSVCVCDACSPCAAGKSTKEPRSLGPARKPSPPRLGHRLALRSAAWTRRQSSRPTRFQKVVCSQSFPKYDRIPSRIMTESGDLPSFRGPCSFGPSAHARPNELRGGRRPCGSAAASGAHLKASPTSRAWTPSPALELTAASFLSHSIRQESGSRPFRRLQRHHLLLEDASSCPSRPRASAGTAALLVTAMQDTGEKPDPTSLHNDSSANHEGLRLWRPVGTRPQGHPIMGNGEAQGPCPWPQDSRPGSVASSG